MAEPETIVRRTYQCSVCHLEYESDWSDEEAVAEREQNFGSIPEQDCDLLCDDCFKMITEGEGAEQFTHFNASHNPHTKGPEPCNLPACGWRAEEEAGRLSPEALYVFEHYLRDRMKWSGRVN